MKILDFGLAKLRGEGSSRAAARGGGARGLVRLRPADLAGVAVAEDRGGCRDRHGGLHVARAGARAGRGLPLGPVHLRRDPLRARDRPQAFRRESPAQTIAAIIEDQPESLATRAPGLPGPLRWVIERCLAKDPTERYASTLDLARELRGLREHIGEVGASGSSPAGPPRPVVERRTRGARPRRRWSRFRSRPGWPRRACSIASRSRWACARAARSGTSRCCPSARRRRRRRTEDRSRRHRGAR